MTYGSTGSHKIEPAQMIMNDEGKEDTKWMEDIAGKESTLCNNEEDDVLPRLWM